MPEPRALRVGDWALALVLAVSAASAVYTTWGRLDRPGIYHDEKAYLFQARTYASLRLTEPSPPVPELWEQVHVFTEPRYASKYPPGFPAVLAVGVAAGSPGAVPVVLSGLTAAAILLFGTLLFGRWTAFLASALWIAAPVNTTWRAAYFAEPLTCFLWVAWTWAAWRYRTHGKRRDLVVTALLVAFAGITRPVTALALALPLLWLLWSRLRTGVGVRHAVVAASAGAVICAVVPFWNHAVLGSWTTVPYGEYSARTFPFDHPRLRPDYSPPPRELPPDIAALGSEQRRHYERRTVSGMPVAYVHRLDRLTRDALPAVFSDWRFLALPGLLAAGGAGVYALASALILVAAHVTMPHTPNWTIYYLDVFPVVPFGFVLALSTLARAVMQRSAALRPAEHFAAPAALAGGVALLGAGLLAWAPPPVSRHGWVWRETAFRDGVCALPPGPKVVFVTPRRAPIPHHSLIDNDPRWRASDAWIVRTWDTARHRALIESATGRTAYHYDEQSGWFTTMNADGTPAPPPGLLRVEQTADKLGAGLTCG